MPGRLLLLLDGCFENLKDSQIWQFCFKNDEHALSRASSLWNLGYFEEPYIQDP